MKFRNQSSWCHNRFEPTPCTSVTGYVYWYFLKSAKKLRDNVVGDKGVSRRPPSKVFNLLLDLTRASSRSLWTHSRVEAFRIVTILTGFFFQNLNTQTRRYGTTRNVYKGSNLHVDTKTDESIGYGVFRYVEWSLLFYSVKKTRSSADCEEIRAATGRFSFSTAPLIFFVIFLMDFWLPLLLLPTTVVQSILFLSHFTPTHLPFSFSSFVMPQPDYLVPV